MGNGFIAIDVDDAKAFPDLRKRGLDLPDTRAHITPGKIIPGKKRTPGAHLIYKVPKTLVIKNSTRIFPDVDIRHRGGQVVCPGSIHPDGGVYAVLRDAPFAQLPAESIKKLTTATRRKAPPRTEGATNGVPRGQQDNALFRLACAMQRQGASAEAKLEALRAEVKTYDTDPAHPFTDDDLLRHVRSSEKYEPAPGPEALERLNSEYCHVLNTNYVYRTSTIRSKKPEKWKPREWVNDVEAEAQFQITDDDGKPHTKSAAKEWMKWAHRSKFGALVWEPYSELKQGRMDVIARPGGLCDLNYYQPVSIPVKEHLSKEDRARLKEYEDWLRDLHPIDAEREHIDQYWAKKLQDPGIHIKHAIALVSDETLIGKSLEGYIIAELNGKVNSAVLDLSRAHGRFNSLRRNKTVIMLEEFEAASSRDMKDLDYLITGEEAITEGKGVDADADPNHSCVFISTNNRAGLKISRNDRRYFISYAGRGPEHMESMRAKAAKIASWALTSEGLSLLRKRYLSIDTSKFNPNAAPPRTAAHEDTFKAGGTSLESLIDDLIEDPVATLTEWRMPWASTTFYAAQDLKDPINSQLPMRLQTDAQTIGNLLGTRGGKRAHNGKRVRVPGTELRRYLWIANPLRAANLRPDQIGARYLKDMPHLIGELRRRKFEGG
jgi:hypothetical protein